MSAVYSSLSSSLHRKGAARASTPIRQWHFRTTSSTWSPNVSLLSRLTPRSLTVLHGLIACPSRITSRSVGTFLPGARKTMNCVLLALMMRSWLSQNSLVLSKLFSRSCTIWLQSVELLELVMSSANWIVSALASRGSSLTKRLKSNGLKQLPCGTPLVTTFHAEVSAPCTTLCFLSLR